MFLRRFLIFPVIFVLFRFTTLTAQQDISRSLEIPFRSWTVSEFKQSGHIVKFPSGKHSERLMFYKWPGDNVYLDLTGCEFFAHEDGSISTENLPLPNVSFSGYKGCGLAENYPVSIRGRGSKNIVVNGGRIIGVQPRQLTWRFMKKFYDGDGIRIEAADQKIVDRVYMENVQDGFSPRGGGTWILRNSHLKYVRDDFVENDGLLSGEIDNCLAEGVFVFLSARPGKTNDPEVLKMLDAREPPVVRIRNTLAHLEPMPFDTEGENKRYIIKDGKACGQLFKWSPWGGTVEVSNCIFRRDQMCSTGPTPMSFPDGKYENVTLIWLGEGDYPKPLPKGVKLSRDVSIWDRAREKWLRENQKL